MSSLVGRPLNLPCCFDILPLLTQKFDLLSVKIQFRNAIAHLYAKPHLTTRRSRDDSYNVGDDDDDYAKWRFRILIQDYDDCSTANNLFIDSVT